MDTGSRILDGKTAVVTGATRGVGRGIGHELARCGARVFVTGRSVPAQGRRDGMTTMLRCDHRQDDEVDAAFRVVFLEAQGVDVLVNSVWDGYENMVEDGVFTWPKPFWEQLLLMSDPAEIGVLYTEHARARLHTPLASLWSYETRRREGGRPPVMTTPTGTPPKMGHQPAWRA